jgi:hypothetical protein
VAIRYYYYDDITKIIEKRSHKRKRGESTKSRSFVGRVVECKDGHDPIENDVQLASSLPSFMGMNTSFFLEVTSSLSTTKTRITELETKLKNVKDDLTSDFAKTMRVVDAINAEQLNKSLQM